MMLGPLAAWAADRVPRHRTGFLGGLMALSPALGALSGVIATVPGLADANQRLWLVAAMVAACVTPAILFVRKTPAVNMASAADEGRPTRRFAAWMWLARLLVQIAEAALFAYLLLYFRTLDPGVSESTIARLFGAVLAAALPIAILAGRYSDRSARPARPLAICASCSALALLGMSAASNVGQAVAAYILFGLATTVFLSLHSGLTLRVLPDPKHRGRDLGIFNLTNTVPSLIMPWLTILIVPTRGFAGLFVVLAVLASASAALLFAAEAVGLSLAFAAFPCEFGLLITFTTGEGRMMIGMRSALLLAALLGWSAVGAGSSAAPSAVAHPSRWPAAHSPSAITDAATEKRITDLIARMTVEQKVGQLVQADISTITPDDLADIRSDRSSRAATAGPTATNAQRRRLASASSPAFARRRRSRRPTASRSRSCSGWMRCTGTATCPTRPYSRTISASAPRTILTSSGASARRPRTKSAHPGSNGPSRPPSPCPRTCAGAGATRAIRPIQSWSRPMPARWSGACRASSSPGGRSPTQVVATPKHFLADGGTFDGKDQGDARIGETELIARHAPGYVTAIDAGALTVMVSFSSWNGVKNHGNRSLLTGVLKGRMGFAGLVVGDWNAHGKFPAARSPIASPPSTRGSTCTWRRTAGRGSTTASLRTPGRGNPDALGSTMRCAGSCASKPSSACSTAAAPTGLRPATSAAPDHLALAREAVAKSLVLLKNEGSVLPIRHGAKVLGRRTRRRQHRDAVGRLDGELAGE